MISYMMTENDKKYLKFDNKNDKYKCLNKKQIYGLHSF